MARNIATIIDFLRHEVIPKSEQTEAGVLYDLGKFYDSLDHYQAPEQVSAKTWLELSILLGRHLGDPKGVEWKERVARIMNAREGIPLDWKPKVK